MSKKKQKQGSRQGSQAEPSPRELGTKAVNEISRSTRVSRIAHGIGAVAAIAGGLLLPPSVSDYDGHGDVVGSAALLGGGTVAAVAASSLNRRRGTAIVDELNASIGGNPLKAQYADVLGRQSPAVTPLESTETYPGDDPTATVSPEAHSTPYGPGLVAFLISHGIGNRYEHPGLYPSDIWVPGTVAGAALGGSLAFISDVVIQKTGAAYNAQVNYLVRQAENYQAATPTNNPQPPADI